MEHQTEPTFSSLVEAAPDAMLVVEEGRIVYVNRQTERMFGYDRDELQGKDLELLVPERLRARHVAHREAYARAPRARAMGSRLELFVRRRDGSEFPAEISLSPLAAGDGRLVSASVRDISEQRQIEEELRQAKAQADAASSAKSEFLAAMSHELRTPLNAILGFAQLMLRDKKAPLAERHRERITRVLSSSEHLLHLIDEVLDLSHIEAGRVTVSLEPVALGPVLAEVKATLDPIAARATIEVVMDPLPPGALQVIADRTRLRQILMNYGSNAIKYGKPGGRIALRAVQKEVSTVVSVIDDGIGIAADKQDKIFQPFQRAGQEAGTIEGTGIGLAISKRLAELMGGKVGFQSRQGEGSEFWLELSVDSSGRSLASAEPSSSDAAGSALADAGVAQFLVVYIEDNPSNIAFVQDMLADFVSVELLTAPTAEIGIELVRARPPHVVIMDINLPGMSGVEAARRLKEWPETRAIPIVALTAAASPRGSTRALQADFHRYLTKPIDVDEFMQVLEALLPAAARA